MLAKNKNKSFDSMLKMVDGGGKKNYSDDRFWKISLDKNGDGCAIIRFLDNTCIDGEESTPVRKYYSHGFKDEVTGLWYIEKSLTTFELPDPVYEFNGALYATGTEENQNRAKAQRRKLEYVSNILVIQDMQNPANDGKVFLFKFGQTIWDKIAGKIKPKFPTQRPVNPFSLTDGCNLALIAQQPTGNPRDRSYDLSEWQEVGPVADTQEGIDEVCKKMYSLNEFSDPSKFRSYDELKARLEKVVGPGGTAGVLNRMLMDDVPSAPAPSVGGAAPQKFTAEQVESAIGRSDDDPDLSEFAGLLKDSEDDIPF